MTFKIISPDDFKNYTRTVNTDPKISFNKNGLIKLYPATAKALNLADGDSILLTYDDETEAYYIGKATKGMKGFKLTSLKGNKQNTNALKFQKKALVDQIAAKLDFPFGEGRLNTVKLDVDTDNPVEHFGTSLFKLY